VKLDKHLRILNYYLKKYENVKFTILSESIFMLDVNEEITSKAQKVQDAFNPNDMKVHI
jgi:hypothetical protein